MSCTRVTLALLLLAFTATAEVVPLTDATFDDNVNSDDGGVWFINFYANWCAWSQKLAPAWEQLGNDEEVRQAGVRIGAVDCAASRETCLQALISGYPTLRIVYNGEKLEGDCEDNHVDYHLARDVESMKAFALKMQAKMAPLKVTAPTAVENPTREEAPRFSVGMVLKLFGF